MQEDPFFYLIIQWQYNFFSLAQLDSYRFYSRYCYMFCLGNSVKVTYSTCQWSRYIISSHV